MSPTVAVKFSFILTMQIQVVLSLEKKTIKLEFDLL